MVSKMIYSMATPKILITAGQLFGISEQLPQLVKQYEVSH
jgi:hypothetical protein